MKRTFGVAFFELFELSEGLKIFVTIPEDFGNAIKGIRGLGPPGVPLHDFGQHGYLFFSLPCPSVNFGQAREGSKAETLSGGDIRQLLENSFRFIVVPFEQQELSFFQ